MPQEIARTFLRLEFSPRGYSNTGQSCAITKIPREANPMSGTFRILCPTRLLAKPSSRQTSWLVCLELGFAKRRVGQRIRNVPLVGFASRGIFVIAQDCPVFEYPRGLNSRRRNVRAISCGIPNSGEVAFWSGR